MNRIFVLCIFLCCCLPISPAHAGGVAINAVGDIMLAGSAAATLGKLGYDYPFAGTTAELARADISIGNLEAPLTRFGTEYRDKKFRFKADPRSVGALKRAGFSILTLANNHMMDFGGEGLAATVRHLDRSGILHTGAGEDLTAARQPAITTVNGVRVAFLAYSITLPAEFYATGSRPGTAPGYPAYYTEDIRRAKTLADYVVVSFHWGTERATTPSSYQVSTAHRAIDAGADLIIGHHPHVLQGIEIYRNGIILYSLGNFAFGSRSTCSDRSIIARVTLDTGVREVEVIPLNVLYRDVRYQPALLKGRRAKEVIDHLKLLSRSLGTSIAESGGRYLVRSAGGPDRLAAR